jgi:hypothetical protein
MDAVTTFAWNSDDCRWRNGHAHSTPRVIWQHRSERRQVAVWAAVSAKTLCRTCHVRHVHVMFTSHTNRWTCWAVDVLPGHPIEDLSSGNRTNMQSPITAQPATGAILNHLQCSAKHIQEFCVHHSLSFHYHFIIVSLIIILSFHYHFIIISLLLSLIIILSFHDYCCCAVQRAHRHPINDNRSMITQMNNRKAINNEWWEWQMMI